MKTCYILAWCAWYPEKIKRKVGKDKKDAAGLRRKKNRFARLRKNLIQGQ